MLISTCEVPSHRIILGGFAQGAGCALRAALSFPDAALGGSVILSGFFGDPSVPWTVGIPSLFLGVG